MQGKPEKLAELMYGGRNGNDQPGDGYTYRGRGYMQLTGKANYKDAGDALGVDLVKHPELAAEPQNASKIATWYWENKVPEAAHSDVRAATAAINGGYNGLDAGIERQPLAALFFCFGAGNRAPGIPWRQSAQALAHHREVCTTCLSTAGRTYCSRLCRFRQTAHPGPFCLPANR